ncbi:hypothetical protein [Raineyella sp.]|uniref:hypothetical protein n=1 Tax=Raineyella sp. TaxID=1911550 RepID=UPI002B1F454B|nr:hypothetical protein [Raineyella sp.]MEA5155570.1 hypothetical protein [Raineyella sp.]
MALSHTRPVVAALAALGLLTGCGPGPMNVRLDRAPGPIPTQRCVGPAVAPTTALPLDVTQVSATGHLEVCILGIGDARPPSGKGESTARVTAVEFTVQNPGSTEVTLPADTPVLRSGAYGPATVLGPEGRVLPTTLAPQSGYSARVVYDLPPERRDAARIIWADAVWTAHRA